MIKRAVKYVITARLFISWFYCLKDMVLSFKRKLAVRNNKLKAGTSNFIITANNSPLFSLYASLYELREGYLNSFIAIVFILVVSGISNPLRVPFSHQAPEGLDAFVSDYALFSFPPSLVMTSHLSLRYGVVGAKYGYNYSLSLFSHYYSTSTSELPAKKYVNADLNKLQIIKENQKKAGVYRWVNIANGNSYVGSSIDLGYRFRQYFSVTYLELELKKGKSIIYSSLLKYGYSAFSLEVLEYTTKDKTLIREQFYLDLLKPNYNILKTAGSFFGFKHSEATKEKMRAAWTEERKTAVGGQISQGWTEERKAELAARMKIRNTSVKNLEHLKNLNQDTEIRAKNLERLKNISANPELEKKRLDQLKIYIARISQCVEVYDQKTCETQEYPSIGAASRAIGVASPSIVLAFKRKKGDVDFVIIKNRYKVRKKNS
jgi:group I intron endonuclease